MHHRRDVGRPCYAKVSACDRAGGTRLRDCLKSGSVEKVQQNAMKQMVMVCG
jgi:hypothetical protein